MGIFFDTGYSLESVRLIGAAIALQQATAIPANIVPLPGTGRFVVIGTPAEVARLLEVAPAAASREDECEHCNGVGYFLDEEGELIASCPECETPAAAEHDHSEGGHHD